MRRFLSKRVPPFTRILLVESGSRKLYEKLLPTLYAENADAQIDLLTCYTGQPQSLRTNQIFRVTDYPNRAARKRLYTQLKSNRYAILGVICANEPIMTKWKWALVAQVPAKVFILNENGDYFWLDRGHWTNIRHFVLFRAGLAGAGAVRTIGRLLLFPFTLLYLIAFAAVVHAQAYWRRKQHSP